jgi:hypothetical protein
VVAMVEKVLPCHVDNVAVTWIIYEKELLARFGPTKFEDYDESLSRVQQWGTLKDYLKEFERLTNQVVGWP